MPYMLLIVEPPGQRTERGLEAGKRVYDQMLGFAETLKARGVLHGVESLASDAKAVLVQVRDRGRASSTARSPRPRKWARPWSHDTAAPEP